MGNHTTKFKSIRGVADDNCLGIRHRVIGIDEVKVSWIWYVRKDGMWTRLVHLIPPDLWYLALGGAL